MIRYALGTFYIAFSYFYMNCNPLLDAISVGFLCGYLDARVQKN